MLPDPHTFQTAKPFPHCIVDGMFDDDLIDQAASEFPAPDNACWQTFKGPEENGKQVCTDPYIYGPATAALLAALTSRAFTAQLQTMTGIEHLHPDLLGGGMHQSPPGAFLNMHADFDYHPDTGLQRVLNVLLFLNRGWPETTSGILRLGAPDDFARSQWTPVANRLVIFRTSDTSFHGHPDPVREPHVRKSLAAYYYAAPADDAPAPHSTVWA